MAVLSLVFSREKRIFALHKICNIKYVMEKSPKRRLPHLSSPKNSNEEKHIIPYSIYCNDSTFCSLPRQQKV